MLDHYKEGRHRWKTYTMRILYKSSHYTLLVVLKLHDEWLDIFALSLPLCNCLLSIWVEVLLLLFEQCLGFERISLTLLKVNDSLFVLFLHLSMLELSHFLCSLSIFLLFLFFSKLKLIVSDLPELCKLLILFHLGFLFLILTENLKLSASLNCSSHISLLLLLLLVKSIGFTFCFSNLSIENLLLIVSQSSQFLNLSVNHLLSSGLLVLKSLLFSLLFHDIKLFLL